MNNTLSLDWIIGFVWGIGTTSQVHLLINYRDKDLLTQIAEVINTQSRPTQKKPVLRIAKTDVLPQVLFKLGWIGRSDKGRKYPQGDIDHWEFIRGYCYTKATLDLWRCKNRRGEALFKQRIRIYGSLDIVTTIDQYFVTHLDTTPKKPYICKGKTQDGYSGSCYCVQYQSKREVPIIANVLKLQMTQISTETWIRTTAQRSDPAVSSDVPAIEK